MQRIIEIKNRLEVIEKAFNAQHPRFKADPVITGQIADLKDYVEAELAKLTKQLKRGELTEFEIAFIEPAIRDTYLTSLDKIKRGTKPSAEISEHINDTSGTLSWWISDIKSHQEKNR